ncbi:GNAT family protein [uncultured Microbulbifer sp.]|uniref:GNAT family N-acetyltransferase n=1 Tax=uncultured Microbulbifer sp. TaxID=348147 RepID=UPI00261E5031|nr:GNAT family protein [uncultured Microbulbifer sp.]
MLKLRQFDKSDINSIMLYLNDNEVTRYITDAIPQPYTESDARWWVENSESSSLTKAIEYKGELVGCISAKVGEFEYSCSAELGYWIGRQFWSNGIATEAVRVFTDMLFKYTDIVRLFVSVVSINGASIRVLEKNGYLYEGTLRKASCKNGQYFDENLYSKISE